MNHGQIQGLLFFYLIIFITKGCLASDDIVSEPVQARLGQSASLHCKVKGEVNVSLSVWSRCTDSSSIAVFQPRLEEPNSHIKKPYSGRVSITEYHTLTINQVQDGDFGEYCCQVTTFPKGSLDGRVHLLKDEEEKEDVNIPENPPAGNAGLPVMMIVYISCGVIGFVILTGIISLLVCTKRRRKVRNPVHVMVTRGSLSPKQPSLLQKDPYTPARAPSHTPSHTPRHDEEEGDDDMYLNMKNSEL